MSGHYRLFSIIKCKLDKLGISIENLDQVTNCVNGISKENYDVASILEKMSDYDNFL